MFKEVFNVANIYDKIFIDVKAITEYGSVDELKRENWDKYLLWVKLVDGDLDNPNNEAYLKKACYYPEFSKIVSIVFCTVQSENNKLVRNFKKIINEDEATLLSGFRDEFFEFYKHEQYASPKYNNILCGYDVMNYDIPFLIKRLLVNKESIEHNVDNKLIPQILKNSLYAKPWDSIVLDMKNVWKFNGIEPTSLEIISNTLNLETNVKLLEVNDININYWKTENKEDAVNDIVLQSANQINIMIKLLIELRNV